MAAQLARMRDDLTTRFNKSRLGVWLTAYMASAALWLYDIEGMVVHASGGIGSKDAPISGGSNPQIKDNRTHSATNATEQTKEAMSGFALFMTTLMAITFIIGFLCAFAGLAANTAKLSMAIQEGNASATQKHLKDHVQFYINTAIAASSIFILELIAYFVGMHWVFT